MNDLSVEKLFAAKKKQLSTVINTHYLISRIT